MPGRSTLPAGRARLTRHQVRMGSAGAHDRYVAAQHPELVQGAWAPLGVRR